MISHNNVIVKALNEPQQIDFKKNGIAEFAKNHFQSLSREPHLVFITFAAFNIDGKGSALIERIDVQKSLYGSEVEHKRIVKIIPYEEVKDILESGKYYVDI